MIQNASPIFLLSSVMFENPYDAGLAPENSKLLAENVQTSKRLTTREHPTSD